MKLLHVIPSMNPANGGPVEGVRQLAAQYPALGVDVEVACCDSPGSPWLSAIDHLVVHALGPSRLGYAYAPQLLDWLLKNSSRFDAIVVDGLWQFHLRAVYLASRKTGVPYFVFTHGMLGPWFKENFPLKHLKKSAYWLLAEYWHLKNSTSLLFTCEEEQRLAQGAFYPFGFRETVIGFGTSAPTPPLDSDLASLHARFPALHGKRVVLFLGRLHPIKGVDDLLHAFSVVATNDLHLLIAGSGNPDYLNELKGLAAKLGILGHVTFAGMLSGMEKWAALRLAEVMTLPSHHENFGVVVAESLSMGTPVLLSNKVNIWREVHAANAGFVAPDSALGAEQNLKSWLALSIDERLSMEKSASLCFLEQFDIQMGAARLIKTVRSYKEKIS